MFGEMIRAGAQLNLVAKWVWLKIKQEGLCRFWFMFPLPRVPSWYRFCEPYQVAGGVGGGGGSPPHDARRSHDSNRRAMQPRWNIQKVRGGCSRGCFKGEGVMIQRGRADVRSDDSAAPPMMLEEVMIQIGVQCNLGGTSQK